MAVKQTLPSNQVEALLSFKEGEEVSGKGCFGRDQGDFTHKGDAVVLVYWP